MTDVADPADSVTDYALAVLLRYFSSLSKTDLHRPNLSIERDREMVRLHWSLCQSVTELVTYALAHHHEIQTVLDNQLRVEDGMVRGRLDAFETVRLRRVSGLATAIVSHEPIRSYVSGPNHVLGWVLVQAWALASRFAKLVSDSPGYQSVVDQSLQRLEQSRRLHAIAQITGPETHRRRPTANALIAASRSRHKIYRFAANAYRTLLAIEAGDLETIKGVLRETLLVPLEPWRRFELAVGLSVAEALAGAEAAPLALNLLVGDTRRTIAQAGRFEVHWQSRTSYYSRAQMEPSEKVTQEILDDYGFGFSSDRPDIVVTNRSADRVEAIVEVKYLTAEDGSDRVRSAVAQIVRYARGYLPLEVCGPLLGRSVIALSQGVGEIESKEDRLPTTPLATDFAAIKRGSLASWARRLVSDSA